MPASFPRPGAVFFPSRRTFRRRPAHRTGQRRKYCPRERHPALCRVNRVRLGKIGNRRKVVVLKTPRLALGESVQAPMPITVAQLTSTRTAPQEPTRMIFFDAESVISSLRKWAGRDPHAVTHNGNFAVLWYR